MEWIFLNQTYRDGEDESSNSKRQAAAQQGEDGVAQVVVDRGVQWALSHIHSGLGNDGARLCNVLLLSIRRGTISWLKK